MKRFNHTLLLATTLMVAISGCSGGKLRNLLSRNDYQSLEEQNNEQLGLPGDNSTQVVSAETQKDKNFFKLPGFLKSEDESSAIAPDPFITDDVSASPQDKVAAYRAKVDQRIAQEAQAAKTTLSDVEKQAQQLYENSKESSENPFGAFAESSATAQDVVASTDDTQTSAAAARDSFEAMFGEQNQAAETEVASPLIATVSANSQGTTNSSKSDLSEFDKLLHAHEQQSPAPKMTMSVEPSQTEAADIFGKLDSKVVENAVQKTASTQSTDDDIFGQEFAFDDAAETAVSANSFDNLLNGDPPAESTNDVWGQLDLKEQPIQDRSSDDVFAAAFQNQQQATDSAEAFGSDFQQTASQHGFSDTASSWANLSTDTEPSQALTILPAPAELQHGNQPVLTQRNSDSDIYPAAIDNSPFFPASQSQTVDSSGGSNQGQSLGLIIPASDSAGGGSVFDFSEQPTGVQQISGPQNSSAPAVIATTSAEEEIDLFADASTGVAVQSSQASTGWTRRTWFLILGCVLIAGLLFLPERQKR